jgi:hypothetical protein
VTLILIVGVITLIFGIVDTLIYSNCNEIVRLVEMAITGGQKDKNAHMDDIGFILGGIIISILLLVAYLKLDELLRHTR